MFFTEEWRRACCYARIVRQCLFGEFGIIGRSLRKREGTLFDTHSVELAKKLGNAKRPSNGKKSITTTYTWFNLAELSNRFQKVISYSAFLTIYYTLNRHKMILLDKLCIQLCQSVLIQSSLPCVHFHIC